MILIGEPTRDQSKCEIGNINLVSKFLERGLTLKIMEMKLGITGRI